MVLPKEATCMFLNDQGGSSTADCMWTDKLKSSLEKLNFWFFSSSFFTIDFKICLYDRCFDTSHCPHDIFWLHFANSSKLWENKMCQWNSFKFSVIKLFSQSFGELTRCSQNMSCGQCEVSKRLVYRHILKSIVKKLEEKIQKFSFFGTWINFNQVCSSHAICRAAHPWWLPMACYWWSFFVVILGTLTNPSSLQNGVRISREHFLNFSQGVDGNNVG